MASLDKIYRRLDKLHQAQQPVKVMNYAEITRSIISIVIIVGAVISVFVSMDAFRVLAPLAGIVLGYYIKTAEVVIAGRLAGRTK